MDFLYRANNQIRSLLYGFFVISHGRRRVSTFQCYAHPTGSWTSQQLREAFVSIASRFLSYSIGCHVRLAVPLVVRSMNIRRCGHRSKHMADGVRSGGLRLPTRTCSTTSFASLHAT